jgi:putative hydrolase of the HAD superfamily
MNLKQISVIFFDFGGTLYDYVPSTAEIWSKIARRLGVIINPDDPRILEGMKHENEAYVRLMDANQHNNYTNLTPTDWGYLNNIVLRKMSLDNKESTHIAFDEFRKTERSYSIFPDCKETLQKLKELNFRIGIISNTIPRRAQDRRPQMTTSNILYFFDVIILSSEIGFRKPQKQIFDMALQKMGISDPETAIHVGDCPYSDVKGARDAGLIPVLFNPLKIKKADCLTIKALFELPELLIRTIEK